MLRSTTDPVSPARTVFDVKKLRESLNYRADAHKMQGDKQEAAGRPELAAKLYIREELFRGLIDRIDEGEYDTEVEGAACKPKPAPYNNPTTNGGATGSGKAASETPKRCSTCGSLEKSVSETGEVTYTCKLDAAWISVEKPKEMACAGWSLNTTGGSIQMTTGTTPNPNVIATPGNIKIEQSKPALDKSDLLFYLGIMGEEALYQKIEGGYFDLGAHQ